MITVNVRSIKAVKMKGPEGMSRTCVDKLMVNAQM